MTAPQGADPSGESWYDLTLVVNGASALSARAITNARLLCDTHLAGRHCLSVVDLQDDPAPVLSTEVLVAPTLVRNRPLPVRKFVGDLARTEKVIQDLLL
jgi:circadian clock protein KaiB